MKNLESLHQNIKNLGKIVMQFQELALSGVYEINPKIFKDDRGNFIKTLHKNIYNDHGINEIDFVEEYYSTSYKNVLRGLHFQLPPDDHEKMVYCIDGLIQDVLIDLRKKSPTYGKALSLNLNSTDANILYLPKGIAHGFLTLSDKAVVVYKTTSLHSVTNDSGIHWRSCKDIWKLKDTPNISKRDSQHPLLSDFDSPF